MTWSVRTEVGGIYGGRDCGDGGEVELESAPKAVVEAEEGLSRRNNK
jgi:hypothetical protein